MLEDYEKNLVHNNLDMSLNFVSTLFSDPKKSLAAISLYKKRKEELRIEKIKNLDWTPVKQPESQN